MPKMDGTGPDGKGPLTGYGRGRCIVSISTPEKELDFLTNQSRVLQAQLKLVKTRINKLNQSVTVSK